MQKRAAFALLLIGLMLGPVCEALAAFKLSYFYVQPRVYEDGRKLNRVWFEFRDEQQNNITEDLLQEVVLRNPKGKIVPITDLHFSPDQGLNAYYDGNKSLWLYDSTWQNWNGYSGVTNAKMINGTYTLTVKYGGTTSTSSFQFNGKITLPIIKASSVKTTLNDNGALLCTFSVPTGMYALGDRGIETSLRAFINIYNDENYFGEVYVRLPSHMGALYVPEDVVTMIKGLGNKFKLGLQLRTNDNNNRSYSNYIDLLL